MKRYLLIIVLAAGGLILVIGVAGALVHPRPQPDYRLLRARALFDTENYLTALQVLREVPAGQKNGSEAHSYLGAAYLQLHLYQAAITEFQEALRQSPRALDPWVGLASTYIRLGDGTKALEDAGKAADISKDSIDAWLLLGRAHWLQREFGEAEKAALKAQQLDPSNSAAVDLLLHI